MNDSVMKAAVIGGLAGVSGVANVVDEMYQLAVKNKARLGPEEQKLLSNRSLFIEKLGYENNRVNTQMGFDCYLH